MCVVVGGGGDVLLLLLLLSLLLSLLLLLFLVIFCVFCYLLWSLYLLRGDGVRVCVFLSVLVFVVCFLCMCAVLRRRGGGRARLGGRGRYTRPGLGCSTRAILRHRRFRGTCLRFAFLLVVHVCVCASLCF